MIRALAVLSLALGAGGFLPLPALAASFDCNQAATPFEHAICDHPALSAADLRLAASYESAVGGLSEMARGEVRTGQREWLSYAQRACTRDARPLTSGTYDEQGLSCLVEIFDRRSSLLEQSRMVSGLRFYPLARYDAQPDPYEADNADSYWPLARHELSWVALDADEGFAHAFNDTIQEAALAMSPVLAGTVSDEAVDDGSSSDTENSLVLEEVAGKGRITLKASTYWYGHGAAHGNWGISYRHYLVEKGRFLEARDLFGGDGWQAALADLALAAARAEHGDNLMVDDVSDLADIVADPGRWLLSDPYALIVQFQPYEISAYAYGAPQARVRWMDLEPYLTDDVYEIRYGN